MKWMLSQHAPDCVWLTRTAMYSIHATIYRGKRFPKIAILRKYAGKARTCDSVITLLSQLSYRTPRTDYRLSTQSHLHCTILRSASDTVWYTEKPGAYVPHVFILRSVAVVINIAHSDILCDHVPDFNIDGFNVFSLTKPVITM